MAGVDEKAILCPVRKREGWGGKVVRKKKEAYVWPEGIK
jgi:hypothetical protein